MSKYKYFLIIVFITLSSFDLYSTEIEKKVSSCSTKSILTKREQRKQKRKLRIAKFLVKKIFKKRGLKDVDWFPVLVIGIFVLLLVGIYFLFTVSIWLAILVSILVLAAIAFFILLCIVIAKIVQGIRDAIHGCARGCSNLFRVF